MMHHVIYYLKLFITKEQFIVGKDVEQMTLWLSRLNVFRSISFGKTVGRFVPVVTEATSIDFANAESSYGKSGHFRDNVYSTSVKVVKPYQTSNKCSS